MHELSIAMSLLDAACAEAARRHRRIRTVFVRIGRLSGVVPDALRFSFELAAAGTEAEGAALAIEDVPIAIHCARCGAERLCGDMLLLCPVCGEGGRLIRGRELELHALELTEDRDASRAGETSHH